MTPAFKNELRNSLISRIVFSNENTGAADLSDFCRLLRGKRGSRRGKLIRGGDLRCEIDAGGLPEWQR